LESSGRWFPEHLAHFEAGAGEEVAGGEAFLAFSLEGGEGEGLVAGGDADGVAGEGDDGAGPG
jgi:hypothetical protein